MMSLTNKTPPIGRRNAALINNLKAIHEVMWFGNELEINPLEAPTHIGTQDGLLFQQSHAKLRPRDRKGSRRLPII